jgi:ABC-2 type transport system permease protein
MKRFFKLMSLSMQGKMYYRIGFLINLFTPLILLAGQLLLWNSIYGSRGISSLGGFTRKDMISYVLVAFCINNLFTWSSENNLSREIRSGAVISRCIRPVPFLMQSVAEMCGSLALQAIVNFSVIGLAFALFFRNITLPAISSFLLFLCSLSLAMLLRIMLVSLFSLLCFYTTSHLGLTWTRTALTEFFSGALIPISMFPAWLENGAYYTPFPYMLQAPLYIFLNHPLPFSLPASFIIQIFWIAVLFGLHSLFYGHIRKNITLAGG